MAGRLRVVGFVPVAELEAPAVFEEDARKVTQAAHDEVLSMSVDDLEDVTVEEEQSW